MSRVIDRTRFYESVAEQNWQFRFHTRRYANIVTVCFHYSKGRISMGTVEIEVVLFSVFWGVVQSGRTAPDRNIGVHTSHPPALNSERFPFFSPMFHFVFGKEREGSCCCMKNVALLLQFSLLNSNYIRYSSARTLCFLYRKNISKCTVFHTFQMINWLGVNWQAIILNNYMNVFFVWASWNDGVYIV